MNKSQAIKIFQTKYATNYIITSGIYLEEIDAWLFETANDSGEKLEDGTIYTKIVLNDETVEELPIGYSKEDYIKEKKYSKQLQLNEKWTLSISSKESLIGIKRSLKECTTLEASKLLSVKPLLEGPYIVLERLKDFLETKNIKTELSKETNNAPIKTSEIVYWEDAIFENFKLLINQLNGPT